MDFKKILTIVFILLIAFVVIGSVQAEANGTKTKIHEIEFNIPDGFEKDNSSSEGVVDNSTNSTSDIIVFSGNGDVFSITVIDYSSPVEKEVIKSFGDEAKVKNVTGCMKNETDGTYQFTYIDGNCVVMIHGPNKEFVESVVV